MKNQRRKKSILILCTTLAIVLLATSLIVLIPAGGSTRFFSGEAEAYRQNLITEGFPESYADALTELHLLHPSWQFRPLLITKEKSTYTWDYVIQKETEEPDANLVGKSDSYRAYRHPDNDCLYDSGYYQASPDTVRYFMDPRNFLNEVDIFQFFDLSLGTDAEKNAVEAVLNGTFLKDLILENGQSFPDYLLTIGKELSLNPVFLAAKARQEQGADGTSPVLTGNCGTKLNEYYQNQTQTTESGKAILPPDSGYTEADLLSLNGYYNLYNIGASGNGVFKIYENAMIRAQKGTADLSERWGGSPSWDTLWKSVYGGAYLLKKSYVDRYQSTVYLQKFNVDSRAGNRNFWGQYMQNVSGAMSEAKSLYYSFAAVSALDSPCVFQIPVFDGMPDKPCPDPAKGTCTAFAPATGKYEYRISLSSPLSARSSDIAVYSNVSVRSDEAIHVNLQTEHSYGVRRLEYSLDGGDWVAFSDSENGSFTVSEHFSPDTLHTLIVRGTASYDNSNSKKKNNVNFLCAVLYINVTPGNGTVSYVIDGERSEATYLYGSQIPLPDCDRADFVGWSGTDGSFLPAGSRITVDKSSEYTARFLSFFNLPGAAVSLKGEQPHLRFSAILPEKERDAVPAGSLSFRAILTSNGEKTILFPSCESGENGFLLIHATTPPLSPTEYSVPFSADFIVQIRFSDGTIREKNAYGLSFSRTAKEVATAALADLSCPYPPEAQEALQRVANR